MAQKVRREGPNKKGSTKWISRGSNTNQTEDGDVELYGRPNGARPQGYVNRRTNNQRQR